MPKRIFWPAAMVTMGLIFLASNLGLLPREFWNLWPVILIVVGLGGLITSDTEEWDTAKKAKQPAKKAMVKSAPVKSAPVKKKAVQKKK